MSKTVYYLIVISTLSIVMLSCDPEWSGSERIVVKNETDREYLVKAIFSIDDTVTEDTIVLVGSNEKNALISDYWHVYGIGKPGMRPANVWIYDIRDSIYYNLFNVVRYNKGYDEFSFVVNVDEQINKHSNVINFMITININDTMLSLMTKNTALTDSIFRLK